MKTIKTTLIAALLLFTVKTALAQDKYVYAMLISNSVTSSVSLINALETITIELDKGEYEVHGLLRIANKMSKDEGWEVYNNSIYFTGGSAHHTYYLKKKIS